MLRKLSFVTLGTIMFMFISSVSSAMPVRVPGHAGKETQDRRSLGEINGGKILLGVDAEYDYIDEIEYDNDGEFDAHIPSGIISLSLDDNLGIYGTLGAILDSEYKAGNGSIEFDDSFIWGVGANGLLYEADGLEIFTDARYRKSEEMDLDTFTADGVTFSEGEINAAGLSSKGELEEWQVALGVAQDLQWAKPYVGVKYLDSQLDATATVGAATVAANNENKDNVGVFAGLIMTPVRGVELNVQGRFIDETAATASVSWKF